jgi:hypothetical protein
MIINHFDVLGSLIGPPEDDPPLVVYSDRMLAGEIASQYFQTVPRRRCKIAEHGGVVQLHQFSASDLGDVGRKPLWNTPLLENQRRESTAEASDHGWDVSCHDTIGNSSARSGGQSPANSQSQRSRREFVCLTSLSKGFAQQDLDPLAVAAAAALGSSAAGAVSHRA